MARETSVSNSDTDPSTSRNPQKTTDPSSSPSSKEESPHFELSAQNLKNSEKEFQITPGERVVIGRHKKCDVQISHPKVSRQHCRLEHGGDHILVKDLNSANGTSIDGEPVEDEGKLYAGSDLDIGPIKLVCLANRKNTDESSLFQEEQSDISWNETGSETVLRTKVNTESLLSVTDQDVEDVEIEDLQRSYKHLGTAYRVSKLLARQGALDGLFQGVLQAVFESIAADRAAVLLFPEKFVKNNSRNPDDLSVVAARKNGGTGPKDVPDISVSQTVVSDVLENGVSTLSRDASSDERFKGSMSIVSQEIRSVVCTPITNDQNTLGVLYADSYSEVSAFNESELELLALIGNQAGMAIHRTRLMNEFQKFFMDTIRAIVATIDAKDGYTHRHSERVATLSTRIAKEAGVDDSELLQQIHLSGLLHDIGKIGIPDRILNKPGSLTDEEYEEVKKHPEHGARILSHIENPRIEAVLPGVRYHHEQWDGSGYPEGLSGKSIPFLGRVLAVGDVIDALTSNRSYRDANSLDKTVSIIEEDAGSHFDPKLAKAAVSLHERDELEVTQKEVGNPLDGSELSDPGDAINILAMAQSD